MLIFKLRKFWIWNISNVKPSIRKVRSLFQLYPREFAIYSSYLCNFSNFHHYETFPLSCLTFSVKWLLFWIVFHEKLQKIITVKLISPIFFSVRKFWIFDHLRNSKHFIQHTLIYDSISNILKGAELAIFDFGPAHFLPIIWNSEYNIHNYLDSLRFENLAIQDCSSNA